MLSNTCQSVAIKDLVEAGIRPGTGDRGKRLDDGSFVEGANQGRAKDLYER
jgi:hypothetical protein